MVRKKRKLAESDYESEGEYIEELDDEDGGEVDTFRLGEQVWAHPPYDSLRGFFTPEKLRSAEQLGSR